jgi:ATP-dependent protease ClpP protease subunit
MPTWGGILQELAQTNDPKRYDNIRRKYLLSLRQHTGRAVILYASKWTQDPNIPPQLLSIVDEDLQGLMEVIHDVSETDLDLILHSPGGSLEAAEAFVLYLRSKFSHIRVIVPQLAMSAATMIACASDAIVLGKHSFLGPIDPQLMLNTPVGPRMVPAEEVLEQFEMAKKECQDPTRLGAWLPMLGQYGPNLLVNCRHTCAMSSKLVQDWLENYMFKSDDNGAAEAKEIAGWLSNHSYFKSHGRHIPRRELERRHVKIVRLEDDPQLQDYALSVFHAATHTFHGTSAVKIVENHNGSAFIKQLQVQQMIMGMPFQQGPRPQIPPRPAPPTAPVPTAPQDPVSPTPQNPPAPRNH